MVLEIINRSTEGQFPGSLKNSNHSQDDNFQFSIQDIAVLYRFHARTILTLAPPKAREAYQYIYSKLMYSSLPLLHTIFTLTFQHDQYLGIGSPTENTAAMAFHWSRAAALLNERLTAGVAPAERDALWACAALLGALAFSSIEARHPEDVWPLHPASNLDWLRLTEGKKEVMRITDPMREDSIFRHTRPYFSQYASPNMASMDELQRLPATLFRLCKFDDTKLHSDDPYYGPASMLAQTQELECNLENAGRFLSFFGCLNLQFKRLLNQKDPCAMILLGYWYAKMCQCQQWYTWRRSYLESQAICNYLIHNYYHDTEIQNAARDIALKCAAEQPWLPNSQTHSYMRTLRPVPG